MAEPARRVFGRFTITPRLAWALLQMWDLTKPTPESPEISFAELSRRRALNTLEWRNALVGLTLKGLVKRGDFEDSYRLTTAGVHFMMEFAARALPDYADPEVNRRTRRRK